MNKKNTIFLTFSIIFLIFAIIIFIYSKNIKNNNSNTLATNGISNNITNESQDKKTYFYDIDGNKIYLSDYSDKPSVILLWKSDNSKSYDMINLIQKYYNQYKNSIYFLAINVNEKNIDLNLKENVKAANFSIPIYFDDDLTLKNEFNYSKLPNLIFIDKDGSIGKEFQEEIDEDTFTANLDLMSNNY